MFSVVISDEETECCIHYKNVNELLQLFNLQSERDTASIRGCAYSLHICWTSHRAQYMLITLFVHKFIITVNSDCAYVGEYVCVHKSMI